MKNRKVHLNGAMRHHAFLFILSFILVVSRRPDALFNAQFWAEDGTLWYAEAYNLRLSALLHPAAGYFQTLPRLAALVALPLPLSAAPLLFNIIAVLIQILPVQFLMSSRCRAFGSYGARTAFAFLYLALPNSHEIHANMTNAQWRLAFLALLVLLAEPGKTILWNLFDYTVLALSAVTGPFIVFIAPVAAAAYIKGHHRHRFGLLLMSFAGAALELAAVLITGGNERPLDAVRDASPQLLVRILAKQVFLAPIFGRRVLGRFSFESGWGFRIAAAAVLLGIAIEVYAFLKASYQWKAFLIFANCILAVSLVTPTTASPQWPNLLTSGGVRYWFFPMLAFIAGVVWLVEAENPQIVRRAGGVLMTFMLFGIVQDWVHPRLVDLHFQQDVRRFAKAPPGSTFIFPLNPPGFVMSLKKH